MRRNQGVAAATGHGGLGTIRDVHIGSRMGVSMLIAGAVLVAACTVPDDVYVESVSAITDSTVIDSTVPEPNTDTAEESSSDTSSSENDQGDTVPALTDGPLADRPPELGGVDSLFPNLGSPDVDVLSYDVRLEVDAQARTVEGEVEIVARVPIEVTGLALDAVDLEILDATVDGQAATTVESATDVVVDLPDNRAQMITAVISYRADTEPAMSLVGLPIGWFVSADSMYVLNEPDGARSWLPSNDHPSDKATWRFELTVPDDVVVSANGDLVQRGGDGRPWIWVEPDPMPSYLIHIVTGDYLIVDDVVRSTEGDLPVTHAVPADRPTEFDVALDSVQPQIEFFEPLFGPYPLAKYGLAFVPSLSGLAMETQGRSLLSEDDFDGKTGRFAETVLAHELAHQWFGNAVTPAEWQHIWLSESFATYGQWLWLDHIGMSALDTSADRALAARQSPASPTGDPGVRDLFGFTSYDGGAAVLHALRLTVGDDAFFELLQTWVSENTGTSQTSDAFEDLASDVHGNDLTDFFETWLYASVLPSEYPG